MTEFDNNNRGSLWGNDKKESERHPDFKGSVNVEGVEYWLSGWRRKEGANPKSPALSLSLTKKEAKRDDSNPFASDGGRDEQIPF